MVWERSLNLTGAERGILVSAVGNVWGIGLMRRRVAGKLAKICLEQGYLLRMLASF